MTDTSFIEVHYSRGSLIGDIDLGHLDLVGIQSPFVWTNTKVGGRFDSMCRGYYKFNGVAE